MQRERDLQSWRIIYATAKSKGFNFKFKFAINNLTNPNFTPTTWTLSFLLKIRKFTFRINSKQQQQQPHAITLRRNVGRFIRAKIEKIRHKFQVRFKKKNRSTIVSANREESRRPYPKDLTHIGFGVVGFLESLAQSISRRKGLKVIKMVAFLLFNKLRLAIKFMNLAFFPLVVVVAVIACLSFIFHTK
ncbi:uncharacterized protein LOC127746764 isoform X1 [Arachis duranensis]|uniref:Uncharacterized protein LOC127746764 isoform X1 n=1 Tax=Arachis duranensis TaxID=130453 RepID=A0A9C6TN27_ARADU|nr:uncharacterized protein LOC127746764 isoform X1 [Arachis duranensis]